MVVLETAGVIEVLVLALKDVEPEAVFVVDMDAVVVLVWAEEDDERAEIVSEFVALKKGLFVVVGEGVRVCIVLTVSV